MIVKSLTFSYDVLYNCVDWEVFMENLKPRKEEKFKDCTAFCPECGSDLFFANDGCYCKASFNKNNKCNWQCSNCSPRQSISK